MTIPVLKLEINYEQANEVFKLRTENAMATLLKVSVCFSFVHYLISASLMA
jgi:hypothetical protein